MTRRAVICFLCLYGVFYKGVTALVQTQRTVMATAGGEACLNCQLTQSKEVLQVTWQKLLVDGQRNLATCNKYFGQRVDAGFQGKVKFRDAGLQNSSIVIQKVTEQDEGCYLCLFNTYPEGALRATTCLSLYELHEPVLHVRGSNSTKEAAVSCSATGRPAPTVTLSVLEQDLDFSHYSSVSVTNTNGTVTVTTTAVLSGFHDNDIQVGCAVRVLSAPPVEVFMKIPEVKQLSDVDFSNEKSSDNFIWIIVSVFAVVALVCVAVIITVLFKQKQRNRRSYKDSEELKTPQKINEQPHGITTPLIQLKNEQVRQRMSSVKKTPRIRSKVSPETATCQRQLFSPQSTINDAE